MKKIVSTLIALMMVLVCFAGCSSAPASESGAADSTGSIKVGVLAPLTVTHAEYGVAVANGRRMYV